MKGFVLELGLIGIIFTIGSLLFVLVPLLYTKIHVIELIEFEYKYDNAQLALMSSLSATSTDTLDNKIKPASEIIGEYIALPNSRNVINISFLKTNLDKMIDNSIMECYRLSSPSVGELAKNATNCNPSKYTAKARITLPFNYQSLADVITLVMD